MRVDLRRLLEDCGVESGVCLLRAGIVTRPSQSYTGIDECFASGYFHCSVVVNEMNESEADEVISNPRTRGTIKPT